MAEKATDPAIHGATIAAAGVNGIDHSTVNSADPLWVR